MSEILKTAGEVRKLSNMFRALAEIGPALELIGSLEQAQSEATARIEKIKGEEAAARATIDGVLAKAVEADIKAKSLVESAEYAAGEVLRTAHDRALEIAHEAAKKAAAVQLEANAKAHAAEMRAKQASNVATEADARTAAAEKKLAALKEAIAKIAGV